MTPTYFKSRKPAAAPQPAVESVSINVQQTPGFSCTPKQAEYMAALAYKAGVKLPLMYAGMNRIQAIKAISALKEGKRLTFVG